MSFQYIVPIRSDSGKAPASPLFLIHSIAGELTWVRHLAGILSENRAIYGFAAPGLNSDAPFFFTLEAMAAAYLQDIRRRQPHGPYLLGGYSMGGVVAYEITRRLQNVGETVDLLVMIDAFAPHPDFAQSIAAWSRNGLLMQVVCNQLVLQWKSRQPLQSKQLLAPDILPKLPFTEHSRYAAKHLLEHCNIPHSQQGLENYLQRCQRMMRVHAQLLADYQLQPLQRAVEVVLFRNTCGLIGHHSVLQLPVLPDDQRNPPHRWASLLEVSPHCVDIEEEHFLLGSEPAMQVIGKELEDFLRDNCRH